MFALFIREHLDHSKAREAQFFVHKILSVINLQTRHCDSAATDKYAHADQNQSLLNRQLTSH